MSENQSSLEKPSGGEADMKAARAIYLPAILLVLVQLVSGMRDLPQLSFFVIYLREELELAPVTISALVAGAQLVGMLTALAGGAISARLGSKWVLACGLALSGIGSLAFQALNQAPAALLWWVGGAGIALTTIGGASYLTRIGARGSLGILAAVYALSMTIGGAIGNPLAGVLIERYGFTVFSRAAIALSALAVLVVALLMVDQGDRARGIQQAGASKQADVSKLAGASRETPVSGVLRTLRQRNFQLLAGMRCLPTIFYGMLGVVIPLLLNDRSGSKVLVATYGTVMLVVASTAQLLAGRAVDRWGGLKPTRVTYSVVIAVGLGLAVCAGLKTGPLALWGVFTLGVLGIAAAWALSTLMFVWVNDRVPKEEHPATFGLLHAVWSLSMMAGSLLASFVATLPWLPFLVAGGINAAALALAGIYYRERAAEQPV